MVRSCFCVLCIVWENVPCSEATLQVLQQLGPGPFHRKNVVMAKLLENKLQAHYPNSVVLSLLLFATGEHM